jgi:cytochrome c biogenesis protein
MRTARAFWRWITSMRTALILLLLLAVAAVPGSMLPQRNVSIERVNGYLARHPGAGPWLDRLSFFDVYSSPWFSAIYLLLFLSLVGCLVPRLRQHLVNVIAKPPPAPGRLDKLTHSAVRVGEPSGLVAALRQRRWRVAVRHEPEMTISAEKGYLKETGNLVFHFALLTVLVGVALGSWYGWHGNRLIVAPGDDYGFCNTLQQYDEYGLGARTGAADLPPFCVTLRSFQARYLENGQPVQYTAQISYVDGVGGAEKSKRLEVNDPLRLGGANLYLLGHGYSPVLRYTDRYGVTQTSVAPFLPDDEMLTSSGVVKFPDANVDPAQPKRPGAAQVAFAGLYLPTMSDRVDGRLSIYPAERNPRLQLVAYEGNLGLGSGAPQSVYELDQRLIASGELAKVGESKALKPGETWRLPDGSTVQFVGTQQWITVSVRHDPGERIVLVGAAGLLVGLMVSLIGKRRRVWARVTTSGDGRSLITLGGLARGEHAGFAAEFAEIAALAGSPHEPDLEAHGREEALAEKG